MEEHIRSISAMYQSISPRGATLVSSGVDGGGGPSPHAPAQGVVRVPSPAGPLPARQPAGGIAQHQRPDPLGVLVGEVQSENSPAGFSHIHHILYTQVVEDAAQVIDKDVQGRLELVHVNVGPAHASHIGAQDTEFTRQQGYPVVPDLPLRENPCCNSMVGADCHELAKSSS